VLRVNAKNEQQSTGVPKRLEMPLNTPPIAAKILPKANATFETEKVKL
jgi:hypothetical protein